MTGQSSGLVMWCRPNTCHSTTSVSSIGRSRAVQAGSPWSAALRFGNSPQGHRSAGSVWRHPQRVRDHFCSLERRRRLIDQRREAAARHQLVRGPAAEAVDRPAARYLPGALRLPADVLAAIGLSPQRRLLRDQREAVRVAVADGQGSRLDCGDGVGLPVNVQVQPGDDEVLVVGRVRALVDQRARLAAGGRAGNTT